jgi:tetratricopeptide (TPR) repeat protein
MPEDDFSNILSPREPRKEPKKNEEVEKILLDKLASYEEGLAQTVFDLALLYRRMGQPERADSYFNRFLSIIDDPEKKAAYLLAIGCFMEKVSDYEEAIVYYSQALSLEPANDDTWYFINNNLGYCLNTTKKHGEAEPYCRAAIKIDPRRHNAYKNLGISMEGQGKYPEAAVLYIKAVEKYAGDPRALALLEELVAKHEVIKNDFPDIQDQIERCREAVKLAERNQSGNKDN